MRDTNNRVPTTNAGSRALSMYGAVGSGASSIGVIPREASASTMPRCSTARRSPLMGGPLANSSSWRALMGRVGAKCVGAHTATLSSASYSVRTDTAPANSGIVRAPVSSVPPG